MGEVGRGGDDKTFRVNIAGDGTARLREMVKEKLKEFMGDYTDDTLVEYVIVLIRNGRQKDEAKKELNVFLGDDSDSFVSWLWDHLSLNMDLYAQPTESLTEEVADRIVTTNDHFDKSNIEMAQANFGSHTTDFEQQGENFGVNVSRSRRNRQWKDVGAMTGSFPLRSTVIEALYSAEKTSERVDVRHLSPPRPQVTRKRNREDGWPPKKRDTDMLPKLGPSRRLLEFAVRDAVKTVQQPSSKSEPALKRLCSVVSSSADSLLDKRPQRPRSTLRMPGSASVALKAAAEAAEDVRKSKNEGSVFSRLGPGKAIQPTIDQSYNIRTPILQDATIKEYDQSARSYQVDYNQKDDYSEDFTGNSLILDRVADMEVDSASDNEGYDDFGISTDHDLEASQCAYSVNKKENSLMLHYNVSKDTDALIKKMKVPQEPSPAASTNPSSKIVNISVNVNTWKPPEYQVSRNVNEVDHQMGDNSERTTVKPNVHILKESPSSIAGTDKEMISTDIHKEIQKPQASTPGVSYTTSRPSENVESRTIYISNVHFGATKDNLSRHFNKFGEVLKVMIVTDPATGQPIGSAYVEFLRKESAELALSLNGTSFMSRILKVVRRSSVEPHATGWSRIARASHFTSRLGRMPFPRGMLPGAFRARFPVKPGARSLQWKRGSPSQTTDGSRSAPLTPRSNNGRNLTYVRPEKT